MLPGIFQIAKNTFRECIRQPIVVILYMTSLTIIGTYPAVCGFVFREQEKLVTDGSLATILMFGWLMAILCASHSISREIESGTVLLVLSKPIKRSHFLIAKFLGIMGMLTMFVWVNGLATLMTLRIAKDQFRLDYRIMTIFFTAMVLSCVVAALINYFKRTSFVSACVMGFFYSFTFISVIVFFLPKSFQGDYKLLGYSGNLAIAIVLVLFAIWILAAISTAVSTRFNLASNFILCSVIFLLGLVSDYVAYQLQEMTLHRFQSLLNNSFVMLLPCVVVMWVLTTKQFQLRRHTVISAIHVHLTFAMLSMLIAVRSVVLWLTESHLKEIPAHVKVVGSALYPIKNYVSETVHAILPNWQLFWLADALTAKQAIPLTYVAYGFTYVLLFFTIFYSLAYLLFTQKEIGKQSLA